uniref:Uncharacterized protein n=1 Tax=Anguilla anguilla TaxID=7936 RepID=A0A0E9WQ79_ANGAN
MRTIGSKTCSIVAFKLPFMFFFLPDSPHIRSTNCFFYKCYN